MALWRLTDEADDCLGWIAEGRIVRTSHALRAGGRVYLIDPVAGDGLEERVRALGEPAAVLQLLDRHGRDCAGWAAVLGVPHVRAWEGFGDHPFAVLPVRSSRVWREAALWDGASGTLVCADALGTVPYFLAPGERLGWHPLVRLRPPRSFGGVAPRRILVGHGPGLLEDAAPALADLLAHGRRRVLGAWSGALRTSVRAAST